MPAKILKIFFAQSLKMITMRNFEKKVFLHFPLSRNKKNFIWARRMQLWPHCRKRRFFVKILKSFWWNSRNCENLMRFPKKLFVKMFVWTSITKFWQACLNHAAKTRSIFFSQSPKRIAMQFCSKKVILSFSSFLQKNKKISIWTRRIQLWPPCQKNSRQNSDNVLLEFRKGRKACALSQQSCFSPKRSSKMHNGILASLA